MKSNRSPEFNTIESTEKYWFKNIYEILWNAYVENENMKYIQ